MILLMPGRQKKKTSRVWILRYFHGYPVPISLPIQLSAVVIVCIVVPGVHGPSNRDLHSRSVASADSSGLRSMETRQSMAEKA